MENFMRRVSHVQIELKAPKGQYNSFGKYKYRSCEDILEAVKPICNRYSIVLTVSDELVNLGERFYVKATATLRDTDSDECISNVAYAREPEEKKGMDDSQITGTASSYARKYALNGLFCIDDTKDADTDEYKRQTTKEEKKEELVVPICEKCKRVVIDYERNGKKIAADAHIKGSMKKYGKVFCIDCIEEMSNDNASN